MVTTQDRPPPPGDLVGQTWQTTFRIERLIGSGGMGEVWLATSHELPGMLLAVKVISHELAEHRQAIERLFGEARAASVLDHPNIIQIHSTGRLDDGRPILVMPYIQGQSLASLCERDGKLPVLIAGKILIQLASALRAAHGKKITHRDIKPQNIMITERWDTNNFVVLLDFGIAKLHDPELAGQIRTRTKSYIGTPGYSAPEQALGKPIDSKADIYAMSVLAYYMLTGRHPYQTEFEGHLIEMQITGAPFPPPISLRPDIPRAISDVIVAGLSVDPTKRPTATEYAKQIAAGLPNGDSLLRALAGRIAIEVQPGLSGATLSTDVPTALSQLDSRMPVRRSRSSYGLLAAGAILGIVSTGITFKLLARSPTTAPGIDAGTVALALSYDAGDVQRPAPPTLPVDAPPTIAPAPPSDAVLPSAAPADATTPSVPDVTARTRKAPPVAKPATEPGRLSVVVKPWAILWIEGKVIGQTPYRAPLPAGRYRIRITNEDAGKDETMTVTVTANKTTTVERNW